MVTFFIVFGAVFFPGLIFYIGYVFGWQARGAKHRTIFNQLEQLDREAAEINEAQRGNHP